MPNSDRYKNLEARLNQLRRYYLPRLIEPTRVYRTQQVDKTMAFTVLAHAEIEQFLEDICEQVAIRTADEWNQAKRISRSTVSLVSFYGETKNFPESLVLTGRPEMTQRIEQAKNNFTDYIHKNNNGVSRSDLIRMLLPVGLSEAEIPLGWPDLMRELHDKRCSFAHHAAGTVTHQLHPHTEHERVKKILEGLKRIDAILTSLRFR
ncbi:MAG: hypothetical protein AAB116_05860 [Candidatus Poribacteria bacterium]